SFPCLRRAEDGGRGPKMCVAGAAAIALSDVAAETNHSFADLRILTGERNAHVVASAWAAAFTAHDQHPLLFEQPRRKGCSVCSETADVDPKKEGSVGKLIIYSHGT